MWHKKNKGFTLVELITVIVILGILATTALPKLINLGSDAERSVLEATVGALRSARSLWFAKAMVCGSDYTAPGRTTLASVVGMDASSSAVACEANPPYNIRGHAFDGHQIRNGLMANPNADAFSDSVNNGNHMQFVTKSGRTVTIDHDPANGQITYTATPAY